MVANRFNGRVAIVTGSSSGIGLAVARRLGAEGAHLILVASPIDEGDLETAVRDLRAEGIEVDGVPADIAEPATAEAAVGRAVELYGRLDILVNNAGIAFFEEFLDTPVEHLERTLAVNVVGMFSMSRAAARVMVKSGAGAVVSTTSTAAVVPDEFQVTYSASKGAIAAMTRALATDLAPNGIRVNAVAPGWVSTRSTRPVIEDTQHWAKHRSRVLLDRPATPEEVAGVYLFLASDEASYVTGAVYACDGGLTSGFRWSNWVAEESVQGGVIGIPDLPPTLGRPAL